MGFFTILVARSEETYSVVEERGTDQLQERIDSFENEET